MTRKPSLKINIKSVATEAGVSPMTVSRVVNGHPDVSEATRSLVLDVIQRTGYQPNVLARSLIQGKSSTLGIVTGQIERAEIGRILDGALAEAQFHGYATLIACLPDGNSVDGLSVWQSLVARQVDGVLWVSPSLGKDGQWLDHLSELKVPPVVFTHLPPRKELRVVGIDIYKGARSAVQHLILRGKTHVGHLAGTQTGWESRQHQLAWQYALMAGGLDVEERACTACAKTLAGGADGCKQLIQAYPEMDSLYADSDIQAIGAMQSLRELGVNVPEQVAVVGFGDTPEAAAVWPALTTVRYDYTSLGIAAVEELIEAIRGTQSEAEHPARTVKPELIVRASSMRAA
jgi:LacI family transcriptional regulator